MAEIGKVTDLFLTAKGLRLQAKVQAGICDLKITKAIIGCGYLQEGQDLLYIDKPISEVPSHQTGTDGTNATVDLTRVFTDDGMAMITVKVKNGDNDLFYLREFEIIAEDPDNGAIPYAYANLGDNAVPIPKYDNRHYVSYTYDFPVAISNAENVNCNITLPAEVTYEEFRSHTENCGNPHNVTAAQVGAAPVNHNHDGVYAEKTHLHTKADVISALGYTPPTSENATEDKSGLMSSDDKEALITIINTLMLDKPQAVKSVRISNTNITVDVIKNRSSSTEEGWFNYIDSFSTNENAEVTLIGGLTLQFAIECSGATSYNYKFDLRLSMSNKKVYISENSQSYDKNDVIVLKTFDDDISLDSEYTIK